MANGGLRINKPLRKRLAEGAAERRTDRINRRKGSKSEAFLRDRGFILPDAPGRIILTD